MPNPRRPRRPKHKRTNRPAPSRKPRTEDEVTCPNCDAAVSDPADPCPECGHDPRDTRCDCSHCTAVRDAMRFPDDAI